MQLSNQEAKRLRARYGEWVLVTGASSGIGQELAKQFASTGFKVIITGRREAVLEELATQWFMQYQAEVVPLVGDLSSPEQVQALIEATRHLPIGIAVLNAGFGTSGPFLEADLETEQNMLALNCGAVLTLSHHFAARMSQVGKGSLVLMSSMVAFQGVPRAAHYAATKAYVQTLGEALALELKGKGVDVLCAAPGPVASGFSARADMQMGRTLSPEQVGVPIIRAIGRRSTTLPGFLTKFLVYNLRLLPRWTKVRIMGQVMGGFTQHQQAGTDPAETK
ncbi:MAG: SDR family oxidoreductase [Bacteroidota bacterium]